MLSTTSLRLVSAPKLQEAIATYAGGYRKLSREVGISAARLTQLVQGHKPQVSAPTAVRLAAALDVEVRALFDFPDADDLVRLGLVS
jgi:DNA-binding Xre family transcriptional regulator